MAFTCQRWIGFEDAANVLNVSDRMLRKSAAPGKKSPFPFRLQRGRMETQAGPAYVWLKQNSKCPHLTKPADFDEWQSSLDSKESDNAPLKSTPTLSRMPAKSKARETSFAAYDAYSRLLLKAVHSFESHYELPAFESIRETVEIEIELLRRAGHSEDDAGEWYECLKWVRLSEAAKSLNVSVEDLRSNFAHDGKEGIPFKTEAGIELVQSALAFCWLGKTALGGDENTGEGCILTMPEDFDEWESGRVLEPVGYYDPPQTFTSFKKMLEWKFRFFPVLSALLEVLRYVDREIKYIREMIEEVKTLQAEELQLTAK